MERGQTDRLRHGLRHTHLHDVLSSGGSLLLPLDDVSDGRLHGHLDDLLQDISHSLYQLLRLYLITLVSLSLKHSNTVT